MARGVSRGEIWMYEFRAPDKRRPVLILSRNEAIAVLDTVTVAPITTTIRGIRSEVTVGVREGLKGPSAIKLDHLQTISKSALKYFIGSVADHTLSDVCGAVEHAFGCRDLDS
jgi:mRNA interferase MazF